ncbi:hypothetical protein BRARA_A01164, partial [Brassica rapa]
RNFTSNTSYSINLNRLVSSLPDLTPTINGFYDISIDGEVNAIALCRGDLKPNQDCINCITNAAKQLLESCEMEPVPLYHILSNVSVMDKEGFSKGLGELLDSLGSKIVDAYETSARVKGTVYALAQCIPDLSKSDCRICLSQIFAGVPTCCDGKSGGWWNNPSCYFRFENYLFFDLSVVSEEKQPLSPPKNDTKIINGSKTLVFAVIPIVTIVLKNLKEEAENEIESTYSLHFDFDTIRVATDDFSLTTKIGEGGFGAVYKRHCLVLIIGISRGLLYLHQVTEFSIIHRVLKSSNVHLDEQMHPKISDFGMARQFDFYKTQATTKRVYAMHGRFSAKTDVYSFGVLVLEIITGKRNSGLGFSEDTDLPTFVSMEKLVEGTAVDLIVHVLLKSYSKEQSMQCLEIAFSCVQENPTKRPTMDSVVSMLSSDSEPLRLPKPSQPGFFRRSMSFSVSVNDVSLTDLSGR